MVIGLVELHDVEYNSISFPIFVFARTIDGGGVPEFINP
jgi:hypothetical protein